MKKLCFLFLFFFLNLYSINIVFGQKSNDSLRYYHDIIIKPKNSTEISSAFLFFEKEIKKKLALGDTISAIQNLRRVAIGQFELGFFYESEATAVTALMLFDFLQKNNTTIEAQSGLLNHLGMVYRKLKLYNKALSYYKEALDLPYDSTDSLTLINNMSNIFLDQEKYDLAINNFSLVYEKRSKKGNHIKTARALDNLGFAQSKLNIKDGLSNMHSALKIREGEEDNKGKYSSYDHLSQYYIDRNRNDEALVYANKAYTLAKSMESAYYLENALSLLMNLDNDPKIREYKNLSDSLAFANQIQENKYAVIKYNIDKEREKTQVFEIENERQKLQKLMYLLAFLISIISIGFIIYYKNQQKKRAKLEATYKTEIRLAKKIHDEVGNDIFYLMTQIKNKPKLLEKDNGFIFLEGLDKVYQKARDISKEYTPIDTDEAYGEELLALLNSYGNESIKIITKQLDSSFWNSLSKNKKIELFWIVRELMTNMRKYSKASFVGITFSKVSNQLVLNYNDNGVGFTNTTNNWGNGLKHVETRIQNLKGNFKFDSEPSKGVTANIKFPI